LNKGKSPPAAEQAVEPLRWPSVSGEPRRFVRVKAHLFPRCPLHSTPKRFHAGTGGACRRAISMKISLKPRHRDLGQLKRDKFPRELCINIKFNYQRINAVQNGADIVQNLGAVMARPTLRAARPRKSLSACLFSPKTLTEIPVESHSVPAFFLQKP
jgi:hypothetical protein